MSFALSQRSYGLAEGLNVGEAELAEFKAEIGYETKLQFSGEGLGTYEQLANDYGWISFGFGLCVLALVLIRLEFHTQITIYSYAFAGLSVLLILYKLRNLIRDKGNVESFFWEGPRNAFAQLTISYDWTLVTIVFLMVVSQIPVFGVSRKTSTRN